MFDVIAWQHARLSSPRISPHHPAFGNDFRLDNNISLFDGDLVIIGSLVLVDGYVLKQRLILDGYRENGVSTIVKKGSFGGFDDLIPVQLLVGERVLRQKSDCDHGV